MKAQHYFLLILPLALLTSCGPSLRIYTDVEERAKFSEYQTYNFLDFTDGNKKTVPGMELERIRVAFARELESRGLQFSEEAADVSVRLTVLHREQVEYYYSYYYYPRRSTYMERAITLDMYDNSTQLHVWHGAAVGRLVHDGDKRNDQFPEVAARLMEKYPVTQAVTAMD